MRGTRVLLTTLLWTIILLPSTTVFSETPPAIIPVPQEWTWEQGIFSTGNADSLVVRTDGSLNPEPLFSVFLQEWKLPLTKESPSTDSSPQVVLLNASTSEAKIVLNNLETLFTKQMGKEGYVLQITPTIMRIIARTDHGVFNAAQSLLFLLRQHVETKELPAISIRDWPDLEMRGITDDISRGQVSTMANFKTIIRFLGEHKMNVYMPYLEDLFQFESYPSIGKNRGALSPNECRELIDFAKSYHIDIIPIFQTLGHYENLLLQPEFIDLAEFPGAASLNTGSEKTYEFLKTVLSEIVPVFDSIYFHMGADESWDVGKGASRRKTSRYGLATVHAQHYRRVYDMIRQYDKQIMMYGDIVLRHPTILNEIPKDLIMFDWHYYPNEQYRSTEVFSRAGQPFIVSAGVHNWRKVFPNLTHALANIENLTRDGYENGAMGSITSNWGDFGGPNFRELNYYPYAFSALCSWNVEATNTNSFESTFFSHFYGSDDPGYAHVYHLLADLTQRVEFLEFFGHPFYPLEERPINIIQNSYQLDLYGTTIHRELSDLKAFTPRNPEHLDYLEICADLFTWYGRLSDVRLNLHRINRYELNRDVKQQSAPRLQARIRDLRTEWQRLSGRYKKLWLRNNREANLQRLEALFERVGTYLRIKEDELDRLDFGFHGRMPAPFVSLPGASEKPVSTIYLRKTIALPEKPDTAWLQLIADSHATFWINGDRVDSVYAQRSLSAWVERHRVKSWDVSDRLTPGDNTIAIRVRSYEPDQPAAANIWFEIPEINFTLTSDNNWRVNDHVRAKWFEPSYSHNDWFIAKPVKNSWNISRPYFQYELPSRIEFY